MAKTIEEAQLDADAAEADREAEELSIQQNWEEEMKLEAQRREEEAA